MIILVLRVLFVKNSNFSTKFYLKTITSIPFYSLLFKYFNLMNNYHNLNIWYRTLISNDNDTIVLAKDL